MKTPSKPKPPASQPRRIWRLLNIGEALKKGDQVWHGHITEWLPTMNWMIKGRVTDVSVYRRRILVCGYTEIGKRRK